MISIIENEVIVERNYWDYNKRYKTFKKKVSKWIAWIFHEKKLYSFSKVMTILYIGFWSVDLKRRFIWD
jgi:hypothetical protein